MIDENGWVKKTKGVFKNPNIFRAKYNSENKAVLNIGAHVVPEKLIGKKLMVKVVEVEDYSRDNIHSIKNN